MNSLFVLRFEVIQVVLIKGLETKSPLVALLPTDELYFKGFVSREEHLIDISDIGNIVITEIPVVL